VVVVVAKPRRRPLLYDLNVEEENTHSSWEKIEEKEISSLFFHELCVQPLVKVGLGELWAYGKGAKGRLGLNDGQRRLVPTHVDPQHFAHAPISAVAAGDSHSAAVTAGGALYTWGRGRLQKRKKKKMAFPHGPWCVYRARDNDTIRKIALKCGAEEKVLLAINRQIKGLRVLSLLYEGTAVNMPPPRPMAHGLREELALAFAMGTHERLGAGSAAAGGAGGRRRSRRAQGKAPAARREEEGCPYLMMPADLVKRVVEAWG
jgi:hypothetical protein